MLSLLSLPLIACVAPAETLEIPNGESRLKPFVLGETLFRVADQPWSADMQGNHRAVVNVEQQDKGIAHVKLHWRRPDLRMESKAIIVKSADGTEIKEVMVQNLSAESADLYFKTTEGAGIYYIYYLPYKYRKGWGDARYGKPWNDYLAPREQAKLDTANAIPAKVQAIESRRPFDFWTSMGLIATEQEVAKLREANPQNPVIFPEDRAFPIKLRHNLPAKWGKEGKAEKSFIGVADRNEYYVWQLGLWAAHGEVQDVQLEFSDFKMGNDHIIPSKAFTCFNLEGVNWDGQKLNFDVDVPEGQVQPLWCGVQIPPGATSGAYEGLVHVSSKNGSKQSMPITIFVTRAMLLDSGDGETWRHSRLRWLNSQIGVSNETIAPYEAMQLNGRQITATGKNIGLAPSGLPMQVRINEKPLFQRPMTFMVQLENNNWVLYNTHNLELKQLGTGLIEGKSSIEQMGLKIDCHLTAEFDGNMRYQFTLSSNTPQSIKDVRLVSYYSPYASRYFMGMGHSGGAIPQTWSWDWTGPSDSYWIGNELVGAHVELRGGSYHGPLIADYKPAPSPAWSNEGRGTVKLTNREKQGAELIVSSGAFSLDTKPRVFEFDILPTPVKKLDTKAHFAQRYFHAHPEDFDAAGKEGANIANIHHSRSLNPVINYPFIVQEPLKKFIKEQHAQNRKVKLYYTIRELTNYAQEIHALMSMGNEILGAGPGYGTPWHTEHLIDGYKPAWYTELPQQDADAALVLSGFSRWINYYLEGLRWMFENYEIDGIYMDDVSFDRTVMKRMRRIFQEYRPTALIDLHSNTNYSKGAMNQYTDFFPYVDRIWFGEHFKYAEMSPDEWFVTFSGIPMGLMSEMLQDGGNPYLGMVYGATGRHSYSKFNPAPIWELQDKFGIHDAKMIGYWSETPCFSCNHPEVKATTFINKKGEMLVVIGNFSDKKQSVELQYLNGKLKGSPILIPEIKDFQAQSEWTVGEPLSIEAKKGVILWFK